MKKGQSIRQTTEIRQITQNKKILLLSERVWQQVRGKIKNTNTETFKMKAVLESDCQFSEG